MWFQHQNQKPNPGNGTNCLPPVGPATQVKERVGRNTLFSSSAMSSGRLFLDRVDRHQSPSPLHRRDQDKLIAGSDGTIYHRTVSSVLTGCLTFRDNRTQLVQLGQTLHSWSVEIAMMWRFTRNNGITEGFHTKMEVLQRQAYGFRNFSNYRLRVKIMCS
jgi:hypothetical protein